MSAPSIADPTSGTTRTRILVTGAAGNIGRKICAHFRALGRDVTGIDVQDGKFVDRRTDLSLADPEWARLFSGQDAVVHLAASSDPAISATVADRNRAIDRNVLAACGEHNVRRIIFASSQWVMEGYFDDKFACREDLTPLPLRPYGVAKLQTEQDLQRFDRTALCLRIGHAMSKNSRWRLPPTCYDRDVWLSDRDLCAAVERAVDSRFEGYAVLNITSANTGSRWPIDRARALIDYAPRDGTSLIDAMWSGLRRIAWRLR